LTCRRSESDQVFLPETQTLGQLFDVYLASVPAGSIEESSVPTLPAEVLSLRRQEILWDKNRIVMQSPKTQCHGKGSRTIPLFPELRPILDEAYGLAADRSTYVVDERYRRSSSGINGRRNCNLRTISRRS